MSGPAGNLPSIVSEDEIGVLLGDIRRTITKRQDVTLAVFRALETLTVDLAIVLGKLVCW